MIQLAACTRSIHPSTTSTDPAGAVRGRERAAPTDWSAGLPDSTSDVVIKGLGARTDVTASFGTVASIGINTKGVLNFEAGASSVTGGVSIRSQLSGRHTSTLYLDEGSSLTIGGRLTNSGFILIGLNNGTTASTIQAAALSNTGIIHLNGSSTAQATIDLTSAAGFGTKGTLTGDVELSGDALIEFKGGQITTIAANSDLVLQGPHAFVADASDTNTNSALERLSTVTGVLELENGATITIAGGVSISDNASGGLFLDSYSAGGSSLTKRSHISSAR